MKITSFVVVLATALLFGCATTKEDQANYAGYLQSVNAANTAAANKPQQPLFRMKAKDGQKLSIDGLDEFVVYAPESGGIGAGMKMPEQYVAPRNDTAEIIKAGLGVVGTVGTIVAVGKGAANLANAVGNSNTAIAGKIQAAPGTVTTTTTTMGANSVSGSGTSTTTTDTLGSNSVLGSGTSSTLGANSVNGAGTSTSLTGTGTTGTGSYNPITSSQNPTTDNHTTNPVSQIPAGTVCTVSSTGVLTCH